MTPDPTQDEQPPADAPDAFRGVNPVLRDAMTRRGFTELTTVQRAVLDAASRGANLRISSQTGSGKTVAIGMALADELIERLHAGVKGEPRPGPLALIVCPTRELAAQVRSELSWLYADIERLFIAVVTGGTDIGRERKLLARRPAIVVGTPGRLLDHVRAGALRLAATEHVILDEADQMLDMGFRDELDAIVEALPESRRSHLVSATFPAAVRRFAERFAPDALRIEGTTLGVANVDIEHVVHLVRARDQYAALVNTLLLVQGARCLVFVRRRTDAAEVAEQLAGDGFSTLPLSGDLPQAQRTRTLSAFRNGIVRTLIATDVAARGIDVADIDTVVHVDLPRDATTYTHRAGRTGRAGNKGRSVLLAAPRDERHVQRVLERARVDAEWTELPSAAKIKKALSKRARRRVHEAMSDETPVRDAQRVYAEKLLAQYDPAELVARLLVLAEPPLPREPMQVAESRRAEARPPRDGDERFVLFTLAWGHRRGATPARVLAQLCRRGGISSQHVGALDIGAEDTRVEIAQDVADAFAARVAEDEPGEPEHRHAAITRGGAPIERRGRPRRERSRSERRGPPRPNGPERGRLSRERERGPKPAGPRKRKGRFPR